jgi:hypothetical protein
MNLTDQQWTIIVGATQASPDPITHEPSPDL